MTDPKPGYRKAHLYQLVNKHKPLNTPTRIDSAKEAVRIMALTDEEVKQEIAYYENLLTDKAA